MKILELQRKQLFSQLEPLFALQGYQANPTKNGFFQATENGSKNILFSIEGDASEQLINVQIGLRIDIIEELVHQFLDLSQQTSVKESNTIIASLSRFHRLPYHRFVISDEESLQESCKQIKRFMLQKGFRFLNSYNRLKCIDAMVNRKPTLSCPYMYNQIHRCFKGITIAKVLHRTDFEQLASIYSNYLYSQWAPKQLINDFDKLVNFLRYFSFN